MYLVRQGGIAKLFALMHAYRDARERGAGPVDGGAQAGVRADAVTGRPGRVRHPQRTGDPELGGWRIKVNPDELSQLASYPQLLRHELTHYLLRNDDGGSPTWLVEGVAQYVGYAPDPTGDVGSSAGRRLQRPDGSPPDVL